MFAPEKTYENKRYQTISVYIQIPRNGYVSRVSAERHKQGVFWTP